MRSNEKRAQQALNEIRENIILAKDFVSRLDYESFARNREKVYAVTRCLEIISEASRKLPEDMQRRYPHIAWVDMASAGNVYRHEYEKIEELEIWNAVQIDLPPLLKIVEQELNRPEDK